MKVGWWEEILSFSGSKRNEVAHGLGFFVAFRLAKPRHENDANHSPTPTKRGTGRKRMDGFFAE
jgi:hypothetical protein